VIDIAFVAQLAENCYGVSPAAIEPLHQFAYDWRGIYRVDDTAGRSMVLRIIHHEEASLWLNAPAVLLRWLDRQRYPAPRVLLTRDGETVGGGGGWWTLMTTFVPGSHAEPKPRDLCLAAEALGQLHRVAPPQSNGTPALPASRLHPGQAMPSSVEPPETVGEGRVDRLPAALRSLYTGFYETLEHVQGRTDLPLCIVHGDCWYTNAILREPARVVFIDWDNGGHGAAVLDLGYLLLTSHYDLSRPTSVQPDRAIIRSIVEGYTRYRSLTAAEREALLDAIRFPLAMRGAEYLLEAQGDRMEDVTIRKLQARYAATEAIARITGECLARLP
jgi:Ser/Thr protein kinase RdoA (MazF antagonist)